MKRSRFWLISLLLLVSLSALAACGGDNTASASAATGNPGGNGGQGQQGPRFTSAYLKNDYDNALPVTMQLTLGTMKLEGTPNAVTAEQATKLLPLWQSMQSGSVQNPTEMGAVYKQIEATMTPTQMQAIATMKLTRNDMQEWAKSQGIQLPQFFQGQGQGGTAAPAAATRRAEFQNMSPTARQTAIAQLRAQGGQGGQGRQGGQGGQGGQRGQGRTNVMLDPLIKLLTARATK